MPLDAVRQIIVASTPGTSLSTASSWIPLNQFQTPFNVGFGVRKHGNDITYRVEHTFDDIFDPDVSARAFTHEDVSAATGDADGNYAFPVRAIRIATVSASGSAGIEMTVLQAGV